jgi:hypothetical protein
VAAMMQAAATAVILMVNVPKGSLNEW